MRNGGAAFVRAKITLRDVEVVCCYVSMDVLARRLRARSPTQADK